MIGGISTNYGTQLYIPALVALLLLVGEAIVEKGVKPDSLKSPQGFAG